MQKNFPVQSFHRFTKFHSKRLDKVDLQNEWINPEKLSEELHEMKIYALQSGGEPTYWRINQFQLDRI